MFKLLYCKFYTYKCWWDCDDNRHEDGEGFDNIDAFGS
jgi:hypothetical protein